MVTGGTVVVTGADVGEDDTLVEPDAVVELDGVAEEEPDPQVGVIPLHLLWSPSIRAL